MTEPCFACDSEEFMPLTIVGDSHGIGSVVCDGRVVTLEACADCHLVRIRETK